MIRPRSPLPALLALLLPLLLLAPAGAQSPTQAPAAPRPIPEALRGAWFAGRCEDPAAMLLLAARSAARVPASGPSRLDRFTGAVLGAGADGEGGWLLGTSRGTDAPRLMLRGRDGGLQSVEPDPKARDDRLPGAAPVSEWRRCDAVPLGALIAHGEGAAVLGALEGVEAGCGAGRAPTDCAAAVVAAGDVSGDRLLGLAELSRLMRGMAWVLAVERGAEASTLPLVAGAGALGGLAASRLLLEGLDFDGDGRLSARELLQDRASLQPGPGNPDGRPLRLDGVGEALELFRGLAEGLLGQP